VFLLILCLKVLLVIYKVRWRYAQMIWCALVVVRLETALKCILDVQKLSIVIPKTLHASVMAQLLIVIKFWVIVLPKENLMPLAHLHMVVPHSHPLLHDQTVVV